jgi:HEAT repeat protein
MSYELLILVVICQLALLLLLLLGMTMARIARMVLGRVYDRELEEIHGLVRRWLDGGVDDVQLLNRLTASSEDAVAATVRACSGLVDGERWEALVELVRRSEWHARMCRRVASVFWWRRLGVARMLALVGVADDVAMVERLMRDRSDTVRLAAARILKRVPDRDLLAATFEQAVRAPSVLRGYLFDILQSHDRLVSEVVLAGLRSVADPAACRAGLEFVEQVHDPIYMADSLALLTHPHAEIRAVAARTLTVFPHPRTSRELVKRLEDTDSGVRAAACSSLGGIGALEATDMLALRLADASWMVRLSAALALRRLGVRGIHRLESAMSSADLPSDRRLARYVLSLEDDALIDHSTMGAFA